MTGGTRKELVDFLAPVECPECGAEGKAVKTQAQHESKVVKPGYGGTRPDIRTDTRILVTRKCTSCGHVWQDTLELG